jgi:hypothetical protein
MRPLPLLLDFSLLCSSRCALKSEEPRIFSFDATVTSYKLTKKYGVDDVELPRRNMSDSLAKNVRREKSQGLRQAENGTPLEVLTDEPNVRASSNKFVRPCQRWEDIIPSLRY